MLPPDAGMCWGALAALHLYGRVLWTAAVTLSRRPNRRLRDAFGQTWVTCNARCSLALTPTGCATCACRTATLLARPTPSLRNRRLETSTP